MKSLQAGFLADMEEHVSTVAMDVDDIDSLEIFGEGVVNLDKLADTDFFNNFDDDFDDSDFN
ncbi:hypothetical protein K2173_021592 [Erythroxylum novogranatense]|uniref:Small acidic protein 1 n=1 Tax=Erythroxylum novogranatense TaxID=1862640 RepID=A0AAV8TQS1_9ROSI|nr:hypothetical protein K2173_021592 [Erythroxylum novogranatense]